jgi:hypothetical protein
MAIARFAGFPAKSEGAPRETFLACYLLLNRSGGAAWAGGSLARLEIC